MGVGYKIISWNKQKIRYDGIAVGLMILFSLVFVLVTRMRFPEITFETLLIRWSGVLALTLLHFILMIGPIARLTTKANVLLYNRRHLGVMMFFIALLHGVFSLLQYHGGGKVNALVSLFTSGADYSSLSGFPYMVFGFFALLILGIMAITSHDFWLNKLTANFWKSIHVLVYLAYVLLLLHVMLGSFQNGRSTIGAVSLLMGASALLVLHLLAAYKYWKNLNYSEGELEGMIEVCHHEEIVDNRAKIVEGNDGISIAVFKYDGNISAVENKCRHQGGPLGEGKIIDGCITCPWHGWQYLPGNGKSPPPFEEEVLTFKTKVVDGIVYVNQTPVGIGKDVPPARISKNDNNA